MTEIDTQTNQSIREVLASYGMDPDRITTSAGNTTSLWKIDAAGSSYVLRRRPVDAASRMRSTHHLLRFLADRFRHAPEVLTTVDGLEQVERPEGTYELLTYLAGEVAVTGWDFDWDDDAFLQSAARLLAELHLALREYEPPANSTWYGVDPMPALDEVRAFLTGDRRLEARSILANLDLIYRYLGAFPKDTTPRHIIHNDFAWYNVVRDGHRAVGVIDFDSAHVNSELHDLAYAVYAFAPIRDSIKRQARSATRTVQRISLFLSAYERGLGSQLRLEPATILQATAYRVALSGAHLIGGYLRGEERSQRLLSHAVGYSEWLAWYETSKSHLLHAIPEVS